MNITTVQAKKILTGNHSFSQLGFSMLVTRMKKIYGNDPTPQTLNRCTDEINAFLTKYQMIMESDYAIISQF